MTFQRVLLFAAACAFAIAARDVRSQETDAVSGASPEEKPPRFTVELIVFRYGDEVSAGSEIFVPERVPLDYLQADPDQPKAGEREYVFGDVPPVATENSTQDAAVDAPGDNPKSGQEDGAEIETASEAAAPFPGGTPEITGFDDNLDDIPLRTRIELHLLEPDQYTMDEIYEDLVELDAYQPIMRTAWGQYALAKDVSPAIRLRALGDPPPGLEGDITLYQGRFVHLGVDLALDAHPNADDNVKLDPAGERRSATDRAIAYGDARTNTGSAYEQSGDGEYRFGDERAPLRPPVRYRISEVRIMQSGDIRYYDHPRFGVIAKITRIKEDETSEEDSDTGLDAPVAPGE